VFYGKSIPLLATKSKEIGKAVGGVSRDRRGGENEDDEENLTVIQRQPASTYVATVDC